MALDGKELAGPMATGLFELIEKLYEEHYDGLYRYLLLRGCQPSDADDYLQESFLRLHRALRKGARVERPKSWLIGVLHHILADETRLGMRQADLDETTLEQHVARTRGTAADAEA